MKHAIAGVAPPELGEVTVMTVWPSIAGTGPGQMIGRLCGIKLPHKFFNVGKLFAIALIPAALSLYFFRYAVPLVTSLLTCGMFPVNSTCLRYRLTNRRVVVEKGLVPVEDCSVGLDEFDRIDVEVLPGQDWYPAGELIFYLGALETFRLSGVSKPQGFRRACLKAHVSYVGVKQITQRQAKAS